MKIQTLCMIAALCFTPMAFAQTVDRPSTPPAATAGKDSTPSDTQFGPGPFGHHFPLGRASSEPVTIGQAPPGSPPYPKAWTDPPGEDKATSEQFKGGPDLDPLRK